MQWAQFDWDLEITWYIPTLKVNILIKSTNYDTTIQEKGIYFEKLVFN